MRSRRSANEQVAEVARRRLELLSAELAAIRPDPGAPPTPAVAGGSGEPTSPAAPATGSSAVTERGRHARRPAGVATGWVEDRLPPTLQGRVRIGASQLTVVAVMAALGLGLLAWWSVRSADPGDLVPARSFTDAGPAVTPSSLPSPSTAASVPAAGAPAASGPPAGALVVDVAGKVRRPGIVSLPPGSRVVDAIEEAGGARRGVNLTGLNLARPLVDGEQVLVGVSAVDGVAPEAASSGGGASPGAPMVNLNTADAEQLDTLPGVGPVTAAAILQWRAENGSFSAVEELLEVSGIGEATLADLAPYVTL
jgi:competence protein ComEA